MNSYWISLSLTVSFFIGSLHGSSGVKGNQADYIVIGLGTAGAVVASELTQDKKTSVIALHNGNNYSESFIIKYAKNTAFSVFAGLLGSPTPAFNDLDLPPEIKKQLTAILESINAAPLYETGGTTPQTFANDRVLLWVMGLPGGGASSINAGAWCRETNQVNAAWEAIAGPNWSPYKITNLYKEIENYHGKTTNANARGYSGPLTIRQDSPSKLANVFSQAVVNATGVPLIEDYNDPNTPIGVCSKFQLTRSGHDSFFRVSSQTSYLPKNAMKDNGKGKNGRKLQVLFNSTALRTIWEGTKAVGVEYIQNGIVKQVFANKGVIVCAGLKSSPFLLHSGVGPQSLLDSLGIPVKFDNPNVGQGLADQPHVVNVFLSNPEDSNIKSTSIFSQIAWLPAPNGNPIERQVRLATVDIIPGITLGLLDLCQPKSRGFVTINSSNPLNPPVIDLGELSNPDDLDLYIASYQIYMKNINTALQAIDPQYQLVFPDPAILDDPVLIAEFVKDEIGANMHFQSHCRMAPLIEGGVVDSTGKVYGVQNLFVADNSIVPLCMDGSPMATGYLMGTNVARMLLGK